MEETLRADNLALAQLNAETLLASNESAAADVVERFLANIDVWERIFAFLDVECRIRTERTSKRLESLMLGLWKRETSFSVDSVLTARSAAEAVVSICVGRIGEGLRSLTLSDEVDLDWSRDVPAIGEGCPNIESIHFRFRSDPTDLRFDAFGKLKALSFISQNVGCLVVASASVFLSIPPSIENIDELFGTSNFVRRFDSATQLEAFFADRPLLRDVHLGFVYTRDESKADIFRIIAQRCPNLKNIEINYCSISHIDVRGVVDLSSMKELKLIHSQLSAAEVVTICERSPLLEVLSFGFTYGDICMLNAFGAIASLTQLRDLSVFTVDQSELTSAEMTNFIRGLVCSSGTSLQRLDLGGSNALCLSTAAIETIANGCPRLRRLLFAARDGDATPESIRSLINSIVDNPSWNSTTPNDELRIEVLTSRDDGDRDLYAAFKALCAPAAKLPAGVHVTVRQGHLPSERSHYFLENC